jgi:hypothetical protein
MSTAPGLSFILEFSYKYSHSVQKLLSSRLQYRKVKIRIYNNIILSAVLYGYETWSLILREEHRLRVFTNRLLKRIFGPKRDEVRGGLRKMHNEGFHNLYSSPSIIRMNRSRRMRWVVDVARMGRRGMHIGYWWESQKQRDH